MNHDNGVLMKELYIALGVIVVIAAGFLSLAQTPYNDVKALQVSSRKRCGRKKEQER